MESVKKTDDYEIVKKRSGRYGVRGPDKKWIGGADKIKILVKEKLITAAVPKKEPEPAPAKAAPEAAAAPEPASEAEPAAAPEPAPEPESEPEPETESAAEAEPEPAADDAK